MNIHQRIHKVCSLVERVNKDRKNPHGNYYYVGHDDVTLALRRAFVEAGIAQTVTIKQAMRLESGGLGVSALVRWTGIDEQDFVEVESYGEAQSMDKKGQGTPQQVGIALSFAVKLAHLKNFLLVGDDTPDPESFADPEPPVEKKQKESPVPRLPEDEQPDSEVKKFVLAFRAVTTMNRYDEVLARAAGIVNTVTPEERAMLVAAAREAKERIQKVKKEELEEE